MGISDSSCNISMSRLVIPAASVFEISAEKQTNRHIKAAENPTHTTSVGVGNESALLVSVVTAETC